MDTDAARRRRVLLAELPAGTRREALALAYRYAAAYTATLSQVPLRSLPVGLVLVVCLWINTAAFVIPVMFLRWRSTSAVPRLVVVNSGHACCSARPHSDGTIRLADAIAYPRRQGHGTRLMDELSVWADRHHLALSAKARSPALGAVYSRAGFVTDPARKGWMIRPPATRALASRAPRRGPGWVAFLETNSASDGTAQ